MFLSLLFLACSDYAINPNDGASYDISAAEAANLGSSENSNDDEPETTVDSGTATGSTECVPTGDEMCDGIDNDCDGYVDEGDALDAQTWYYDADGDGHGSFDNIIACAPPAEYVASNDDCDDTNITVHPGAEEVCDWIPDNNCDGILDTDDLDGSYDSNSDGDYDDEGDAYEASGPDGYTWCYQYNDQLDTDHDGYCSSGMDLNGDGDCIDAGDILLASDQECPKEYHDCDVTDPNVYPGHGC